MTLTRTRLAAVLAGLAIGAVAHAQPIKIAYNGDLSVSPSAQSGHAAVLGMQAAIDDVNAAGGVQGRKLTLVVRDDKAAPAKAIENMAELIDTEKVVAVFGPTNSGNGLAWKHVPNQRRVPVIVNVGSGTDLTTPLSPDADNYVFRVSMVDREQIAALMAYARKNRGASKVVGFMAETTGYGQGGLKDMEEIAARQGLRPAAVERFGVQDTDMSGPLARMKAAGVDTIVVWAQGSPTAQLVRSMEKMNYFPIVLSSWAADNGTFYDAAGKELAGKPLFLRTVSDIRTPPQQKMFLRLRAQLRAHSAFAFALHGYDSVLLLAQALRQAGSTEGPAVKAALENLKLPVFGLMKIYVTPFSRTHHEALTARDLVWTRWVDGRLEPYADDVTVDLKPADFRR